MKAQTGKAPRVSLKRSYDSHIFNLIATANTRKWVYRQTLFEQIEENKLAATKILDLRNSGYIYRYFFLLNLLFEHTNIPDFRTKTNTLNLWQLIFSCKFIYSSKHKNRRYNIDRLFINAFIQEVLISMIILLYIYIYINFPAIHT